MVVQTVTLLSLEVLSVLLLELELLELELLPLELLALVLLTTQVVVSFGYVTVKLVILLTEQRECANSM